MLVYIIANTWIENKIEKQLAEIPAKASEVNINLFSRSVKLTDFEIFPVDSTAYSLRLKKLVLKKLDVKELWDNNNLVFDQLQVDSGKISFDELLKENKRNEKTEIRLNNLAIHRVTFNNIIFEIVRDTASMASFVVNLQATGFVAKLSSLPAFSTETFDGALEKIEIQHGIKMYRLSVRKLAFSSQQRKIVVDSALLIPVYNKFEFAHHKGEQVGRISVSIPKIVIHDFDFKSVKDSVFNASLLEIQSFDLHSFKDKRVPFLRDYRIPLPMESFQKVRYPISVDSLVVKDSRVTIEEITEKGTESGVVVINQINAFCGKTKNRPGGNPNYAALTASGYLMNAGEINATFMLPLDGSSTYYAKGNVAKLPFEKLNPALENMARLRIESGQLNNLRFDFKYTDDKSVGTLEIDYEDLKITGLKRKSDDRSGIKTFLFNTIIKDSKSQALPKQKRTGTINIERDKRRYVFNIWWKSILNGLVSAILGIEPGPKQDQDTKSAKKNAK